MLQEFSEHIEKQYNVKIVNASLEMETTSDGIIPIGSLPRIVMEVSDEQIKTIRSKMQYGTIDTILEKAWINAKMNNLVMPSVGKGMVSSYGNKIEIKALIPIIELFVIYLLE